MVALGAEILPADILPGEVAAPAPVETATVVPPRDGKLREVSAGPRFSELSLSSQNRRELKVLLPWFS